jgi:hypothetical protein
MRIALAVVATAIACGPSSAQIKTARTATYAAEPAKIFELALEAARDSYKIAAVDERNLAFATLPRTYSREGDLESPGADGVVQFRDRSVRVELIVHVITTADRRVAVTVTPRTLQLLAGSPQPRELKPDDPYLPAFVLGRADALSYAIYTRAKSYSVAPP